jgi:hypothetical protein
VVDQTLPTKRAPSQTRQVGLGCRLVDEDQPRRIETALAALPSPSRLGDVWSVLLGCMERLFLYVRPIWPKAQWIAAIEHSSFSRSFISASVKSGSFANRFLD